VKLTDRDHAAEAIEHLAVLDEHVASGSWDDQVMVDAVCLRLAAAVDAVARISDAARHQAFGETWPAIRSTRNRIVHGYLTVDARIVRATVEHDLPRFRAALSGVGLGGDDVRTMA
jgi:uncharacterized protein with HEPN domain